jgi:TRAP-type uncharacterized transport system substrate-binding protein
MKFVAKLYQVVVTVIVHVDSKFESISDLKGRRVAILNIDETKYFISKFLNILTLNNIKIIMLDSLEDLITIFDSASVDAICILCSHPNDFITTLSIHTKIRILHFTGENPETLQIISFYFPETLTIRYSIKDYRVFYLDQYQTGCGINKFLLCDEDILDDTVYSILNTIVKNIDNFKYNYLWSSSLDEKSLVYCPPHLEYHPGAYKFYLSNGSISIGKEDHSRSNLL